MQLLNKQAPELSIPDQHGNVHTLSQYKGKWVLLYFYPKDNTPGCTKEAELFQGALTDFKKHNTVVLGVSPDSVESHKKFAEKFSLEFPLLADVEKSVVTAYGVWGEKKFMGRTYMGTMRTSFLIDPEGKVVKVYENVKPKEHTDEVLADLQTIQSNEG